MSVPAYRGLTWDHPRGYTALEAAAARAEDVDIAWDRQPLEGFESHPIADLCARYDLVVLDHPHVGEAVASDCLVPIDELFNAEEIARWRAAVAGPSLASYHYAGRHWALPLDAATQVMAYRRSAVEEPPVRWEGLPSFAERHAVALSLSGPHAILSFQSISGALGADRSGDQFVDPAIGREAYAIMAALTGDVTVRAQTLNPIAMLDAIERDQGIDLCPLIYGYVSYAWQGFRPVRLAFADMPRCEGHGPVGSALGGTGIAVSQTANNELKLAIGGSDRRSGARGSASRNGAARRRNCSTTCAG